ncbi:phosphate system positive regulatory protein pho81 [Phlyctochytrium bullatum]|nr:phosphate system positive regulatory protein pho81 [Phlyctochytrium bullatum]
MQDAVASEDHPDFGKFIQEQQSEWGGAHFLNYKALKKIINSFEGEAGLNLSTEELHALKTAFFFKLERELEKINAFYLQKEAEFKVRLRSLVDKKKIILSKPPSSRKQTSLLNLKEAFSLFQHDLTKLQNFVEVNQTGFGKILKKWDKRAKSSTKELYLSRQVEIQPCFNNDILAELTDAATTNLAELDALLDSTGTGGIPPLSEYPRSDSTYVSPVDAVMNLEDPITDLENDLIALLHDNRVPEINEFLEKRRQSMPKSDHDDLLSRVFFRISTESSVETLKVLLSTKAIDVNLADDINSRSCLHEASILGKLDIVRLLASNGANVQALDMYGRSPLHYAAMYGRYEVAVFLISSGCSVDQVDLDDCSPMIHAVIGGHSSCVQALLEHGAALDRSSSSGPHPLSLACEYGHKDIATLLLKKGAKLASNNDGGLSALHVTAREGHVDLCSLLISSGADVDLRDSFTGWTPIFYSASEGHLDCVKVLLAAGCSLNIRDESGWLPWTYALYRGHIEVAKLLEVESEPVAGAAEEGRATVEAIRSSEMVAMETGIKPMAPSALFIEDMEMDGVNIDSIPSLSLPPPIIPFRIYGHNYLEKKSYLQLNFNSNLTSSTPGNPIKLFGSRQLSSLKLTITSKPDLGIPYSVILPLKDDSEVFTFLIDDDDGTLSNFSLQFDIYPTFGTKVLGRAVVLASQMMLASRRGSAGAADNEVCVAPLFDSHLRVVGELSFEFSIVKAFNHEKLRIGGKVDTYWKSTQVVNTTRNSSDSGVRSFITASSLVEEYINLEVQLSRDLKPVVYADWFISGATASQPFRTSLYDLSFAEAVKAFNMLRGLPQRADQHPVEAFRGLDFKTYEYSRVIQENLFSLEDILMVGVLMHHPSFLQISFPQVLPPSLGLCIDIKYPTSSERSHYHLQNFPEVNTYVDLILKTIYDHGSNRSFIFSSFNPSICTALSWKQPNYGVFFKTKCGFESQGEGAGGLGAGIMEQDRRCTSIKEAVRFAKRSNFLGIICEATPLIKVPALVNTIKESGLILGTFGQANSAARNVAAQEASGVDAILAHGVFRYNTT